MVQRVQHKRTSTNNNPPADGSLNPGEFFVEMGTPTRLWVGVPVGIAASRKRELLNTSALVTSVNGASGAVSVTPAGIGALPAAGGTVSGNLNVTGTLQRNGTDVSLVGHIHAIANVTGLQTALDSKAASAHNHAIADVTGLQTALDGKAASAHNHAIADVTGLQTALDGKAASAHGHIIADVTGLQTALNGKAASSHTHPSTEVTGLGTAATLNVGTGANQIVQLDGSARLPAVDGSLLTNVGGAGAPPGSVMPYAGLTEPSGWLFCFGQSLDRATYPALFNALHRSATVTITIASPGVITWVGHGLAAGDPVTFETTGALPTNIVAGTTYFVIATGLTADTFRIAATVGGAAINTSGTQSGVHTCRYVPHRVASTTTFNLPDLRGRAVAGRDNMGGVSANRLTNQTGGIEGDTLGAVGGAETHTLTVAQMPSHTHTIDSPWRGGSGSSTNTHYETTPAGNTTQITPANTGGGGAHNNVQPTIMLNYIIKT